MWCSVLPLLFSLSPAVLILLQLPDYADTQEDYKYGRPGSEKKFCTWKCLLFTVQWPAGFCQFLDRESLCQIPQSINNWTIHGLWPLHVMDCCNCWPMFQSDVEELEAELTEHWPSLLKIKSSFHFWREEWHKHGVCAACVEGMNSPLRYFQICLKLQQHFDIHKLLGEAGITPSCDRLYKVSEVHQVLAPHLGDKHEIQCVTDDKDREVWFQVKIPLSRNLTIGCDHHGDHTTADIDLASGSGPGRTSSAGHPCPAQKPFYYLPIDHEHPRQPCG
ncbi:ribonuclease T2-like [Larimichthys crocea]|uniref:ribonuclease T2-like n=1 Tax=Larimichthys crocea TaxID=215358 RepID=UPI000F5D511E|nr:ribonuclease Oy-like [Larimichthys crocea]XP_027135977.1 ribonuclease Oy-like [Larimichthys crocea]XP_027135978.1 ribonuclease Oy-like [Larimichthys crocea]XP_027135979.1 ribonuclease Oy-like [Larimichthys crocea]